MVQVLTMNPRRLGILPLCLLIQVLSEIQSTYAYPDQHLHARDDASSDPSVNLETNNDGSTFVWTIQDTFEGQNFFDDWSFFTGLPDPTHGTVNYVNSTYAFSSQLAYVTSDNKVIMRGDNFTSLAEGQNRDSVRISTKAQYNTGLFILDLDHAPFGCAIWPAFWTTNTDDGTWPYLGEIDILEGVHDNEHNQVTFHSGPGCTFTPTTDISGTPVTVNNEPHYDCNGLIDNNSGCGVLETSRASYGPFFDSQGGGVFAMKWDENGISIWSFYRAAIPEDIQSGNPSPDQWGEPVSTLLPAGCDPIKNFVNHSVIFDITFCGDWAGNSYSTAVGCPGTCAQRIQDPANFDNASWTINSLKVYKKQPLSGVRASSSSSIRSGVVFSSLVWVCGVTMMIVML